MSSGRWIVQMCARTSVVVVIAAAAAAPPVSAEVLHDQRGMIGSGEVDGHIDALIGGAGTGWGEIRDQQACEDFVLVAHSRITRVTVDFVLWESDGEIPIGTPPGGFLVEFFPDVEGTPSETPAHVETSFAFARTGTFTIPTAPTVSEAETGTFAIDLAGAQLEAGVWCVSVVWVDETPFGQLYKWAGVQQPEALVGGSAHNRAGGVDHGNGYPGQQVNSDWRVSSGTRHHPKQLSFTIEGFEVPSADIDGDGVVGSADLAALLGQWGPCGGEGACPADLDSDGAVGSADLASLLGAWGTAG